MRKYALQITLVTLCACSTSSVENSGAIPALDYARKVGGGYVPEFDTTPERLEYGVSNLSHAATTGQINSLSNRAQLRMASNNNDAKAEAFNGLQTDNSVSNIPEYEVHRSSLSNTPDYNGPLALGDPGVTASLWRSSQRGNNLFQDDRAWQPYDLITIVVTENSEGKKEADTEVKTSSEVAAAIENFLGAEKYLEQMNSKADLSNLIKASTTSNFKGEGDTSRKGSLRATISAMVVEILPGGVLRIEGEKIIAVNQEEQILVISGLVRPRDISSDNEVDSAKVAQLRIDFFGKGSVGSAQTGGWLSNLIRYLWPF